MRIAVIGWGSLIWCRRELRLSSNWYPDGPELPIEFARISSGDRLTLVILPGSQRQSTYWAKSQFQDLENARANLKEREGTRRLNPIHFIRRDGVSHPDLRQEVKATMEVWMRRKPNIDAAIWTGLQSNWKKMRGKPFNPYDAIAYLKELDDSSQAEGYIRKAPSRIQSVVRQMVESELGWTPYHEAECYPVTVAAVQLSPSTLTLFEECPACFWRHFHGLKRPERSVATIATGLDRAIKGYFDRYRVQGILPPLVAGKLPGRLAPTGPRRLA